jgi:hypothetical protein
MIKNISKIIADMTYQKDKAMKKKSKKEYLKPQQHRDNQNNKVVHFI